MYDLVYPFAGALVLVEVVSAVIAFLVRVAFRRGSDS